MKKTVRLTEQQLHNLITEALLTEADWKTYMNAAKKRLQQQKDDVRNRDFVGYNKHGKHISDLERTAERAFADKYGLDPRDPHCRVGSTTHLGIDGCYVDDGDDSFHLVDDYTQKRIPCATPTKGGDDMLTYQNGRSKYTKGEGWNESIARRVTESVVRKLQKLNEAEKVGKKGGWPIYYMGCNYEEANFDEIAQIIGDCTGKRFQNYFFSNEQWDRNDLQSKIFFNFNDTNSEFVVTVGGGCTIYYDDEDAPQSLDVWMGMDNYSVAEISDKGHYDRWSDLSKDMTKKVDWKKVEAIIGSYSIDSPTPEFLDAFDTGMEKQVLGYDRETSQGTRPSAPQFI